MEDNSKEISSHKSILKATGVFGMMQIIKLTISIVSSKFVAVFLGPIGIGLVSLLTNALNIILAITNFEFLKTATREVALQNELQDKNNFNKTIATLQKMAIFIGLLGAVICILFSKTLSHFTFGNYSKQHWFIILSLYLLFTSFSNARMAILQGVNKIKILAFCNIVIAFLTAVGTITIYYFFKIDGIIWALLYSSFILFIVTLYFTKQYSFNINPIVFKEFYTTSLPIFKLGFFLSLNLIFGQICNFIIKLYLNDNGASSQILGFYEVSTVILVNYLGLIFNAMSYDFYPKLSALSTNNSKVKELVNNQIEIALILVTPAIIFLYLAAPLLIELLYTKEFVVAFTILKIALFSVIIKGVIMPLAYIILAKGNKKQYFKQELFSDFLNISLTILFYNYFGLTGIGIAYILNYIFYGLYVYYIVNKEYDFSLIKSCQKLIKINFIIGIIAIVIVFNFQHLSKYLFLTILFILSLWYSYQELNKRINLKDFFLRKYNR